jgi:NADH-quinone oxidoreductase subunit N
MSAFLILMKPELVVSVIIFLLLFIKLGKGMGNGSLLALIQVLLLINFAVGFAGVEEGNLFGGLYKTSLLIAYQKSILNLGVFLISLLFADWFKQSNNLAEFFILLLSALLGMHFLLSSNNLLMFYLSLELSTIPVAAMANFDLQKRKSSEAAMKMILTSMNNSKH